MSDNGRITWKDETRKLGDLKPWPRNPRQIMEKQAKRLTDSFDSFGQVETLAIGPDGEIYNGHQRLNVLMQEHGPGFEVAVRIASRPLTEKEREKLTVYLHKGAAGEWDFDILANEFELPDLLDWGFEKQELDIDLWMPEPPEDPGPQLDKAEELRQKWGVETGQLWELGEHRVICGDCTDGAVAIKNGNPPDMILTDAPYGVDYSGQSSSMYYGKDKKGKPREKIIGDDIHPGDLIQGMLNLSYAPIIFLWHAPQMQPIVKSVVEGSGYNIFSLIVWNKNHANFGAIGARYKPKFEMGTIAVKDKIPWYGPDNEVTVWDIDRSSRNEHHPTQKPVELMERAIKNHVDVDGDVYDPFLGSGTTLIACERLSRKCRGVEISPAYVAVTLQRWHDMTGREPVLID